MSNNKKESPMPIIAAFIFMGVLSCAIYYEEIMRWLYAHNMWYLPIKLN